MVKQRRIDATAPNKRNRNTCTIELRTKQFKSNSTTHATTRLALTQMLSGLPATRCSGGLLLLEKPPVRASNEEASSTDERLASGLITRARSADDEDEEEVEGEAKGGGEGVEVRIMSSDSLLPSD